MQATGTTVKPPSNLGQKPVILTVDEAHEGQRLDNFLFNLLKRVPKTHVYRIIRKGEVRINKGRVKQTTRLKSGDLLRLPPIKLLSGSDQPAAVNHLRHLLDTVLFEDDALLVINKPSGIAVHAGSGITTGVIEALRSLRPDLPYLELAHRLDRETSGCLMLAKKTSVLRKLNQAFAGTSERQNALNKQYLALVQGHFRHGARKVTKSLDTEARLAGQRHVRVSQQGSYACSVLTPLKRSSVASLLRVELQTGRTHQVRVHCQSEGHPIAGDTRYGDEQFNLEMRQNHGLKRLFLHAVSLGFNHPVTEQRVDIEAPLPDELASVVRALSMQDVS